ncbi:MAG: TrbC/VirB2 family protein [Gammaproteobacteria bacterium]|nr:MAG: TrbC/VirB2 family protein [Gammaproteobacteria bacterium]TLZ14842.1 MAG: TrbC/VirB2 family protein [Gammaproteobacteria bacterium]TLZ36437.1 MAG: TrbC/VirB2 family protein [Gammaproteobacteria bacterium]TMJ00387.1 MAG: TrbC/VirB2 family protein [Alphaproteobacteria bacterium]
MTASRPQLSTRGRAVGRITAPRLRSARWPPTGVLLLIPASALAQASPFNTGANSLLQFTLTIATPIAALIVIGLAIAAAVGKIAWSWVIGAIVGIAAIFGAPQIVAWIRSMFGV